MDFYEIEIILENLYLKHKNNWEQARMISYIIAQSNSTKKIEMTDLLRFTWDNQKEREADASISNDDIERLKIKAQQYINSR